jgi:hypothetical protein
MQHHLAKFKPWHGLVAAIAVLAIVGMISLAVGVRATPRHAGFSPASSR